MSEGRTHWVCLCGRRVPLSRDMCSADDCENGRVLLEDEDAIPAPAVGTMPHGGEEPR